MELHNILYEVKESILYLTLNRPEVYNALSPEMWKDLNTAIDAARNDPEIRVIIITGAGDKALASGADIKELHSRYYMEQMKGTATLALICMPLVTSGSSPASLMTVASASSIQSSFTQLGCG